MHTVPSTDKPSISFMICSLAAECFHKHCLLRRCAFRSTIRQLPSPLIRFHFDNTVQDNAGPEGHVHHSVVFLSLRLPPATPRAQACGVPAVFFKPDHDARKETWTGTALLWTPATHGKACLKTEAICSDRMWVCAKYSALELWGS